MNFLAHLYLSGNSDDIKIGNFIGDHVKGKQYLAFPKTIQTGILLHRQIDFFTDQHPSVKKSIQKLRPAYRKYSGVIVDLFFDHFLASLWTNYSDKTLAEYTREIHALLLRNFFQLPSPVKQFLPFLIQHNRLQSYAEIDGIIKAIEIMSRHTSLPAESQQAQSILLANYEFFKSHFEVFFEEITLYVQQKLETVDQQKQLIP